MKAWCFYTTENIILYRTLEALADNPSFFSQSEGNILLKHLFDTNNDDSMVTLIRFFKDQELSRDVVKNFMRSISYDYLALQARVKSPTPLA